jgi:hypothetical protein
MSERDEEPTQPGTPRAVRLARTKSGAYEIPPAELDDLIRKLKLDEVARRLFEAQIRVLQERLAVVEADLAALRAEIHMKPPPAVKVEEVRLRLDDPRREP